MTKEELQLRAERYTKLITLNDPAFCEFVQHIYKDGAMMFARHLREELDKEPECKRLEVLGYELGEMLGPKSYYNYDY